jgi:hypothetical protein
MDWLVPNPNCPVTLSRKTGVTSHITSPETAEEVQSTFTVNPAVVLSLAGSLMGNVAALPVAE